MAQNKQVRGVATKVIGAAENVSVRYHATVVAERAGKQVTLRNGGYLTNTTKTRINQFANEFCGGVFNVYQKAGSWFVSHAGAVVPFEDGMTFAL